MRGKKIGIIIIIIFLIVAIIAGVFAYLFLATDIFKGNKKRPPKQLGFGGFWCRRPGSNRYDVAIAGF